MQLLHHAINQVQRSVNVASLHMLLFSNPRAGPLPVKGGGGQQHNILHEDLMRVCIISRRKQQYDHCWPAGAIWLLNYCFIDIMGENQDSHALRSAWLLHKVQNEPRVYWCGRAVWTYVCVCA